MAKKWFENYLTNRKQIVQYNEVQSDEMTIKGVIPSQVDQRSEPHFSKNSEKNICCSTSLVRNFDKIAGSYIRCFPKN